MSNMKAAVLFGLSIVMPISLSAAANAAPVLVGTTTNPTGINDLVVDGTTYDVTFSLTTLNTFKAGSTLSLDAATALVNALNSLSVTELNNIAGTSEFLQLDLDNSLSAPADLAEISPAVSSTSWVTAGLSLGSLGFGSNDPQGYLEAADFTAVPTTTPLPATLPLFATGLGALGLLSWRRKRKARVSLLGAA